MQPFLNFLVSLRRLPPLSLLSGDEERLLFELRCKMRQQGSLSVADVYDLANDKSATTAYRWLIALKDKGFVAIEVLKEDKRKRSVTFTKTAQALFSTLTDRG